MKFFKNTELDSNTMSVKIAAKKIAAVPIGTYVSEFGTKAMMGAGLITGVLAIAKIVDMIQETLDQRNTYKQSDEYFEKMLIAHPELKRVDPKTIALYWESLYHFAPHVAQDPLASGAYIKQSIAKLSHEEFGGPPPETFKTLADIQHKYTTEDIGLTGAARKKAVEGVVQSLMIS